MTKLLHRYGATAAFPVATCLGIWLALVTTTPLPGLGFMPVGVDAFYHATRVLAVAGGAPFYEWDPRGFYPDGDWIAWPWLYDWLLAGLARAYLALGGTTPMTVLAQLPPLMFVVNLALAGALCGELKLPTRLMVFVLLALACLPVAVQLHLSGRIDHHDAELTGLLLVTWWLLRLERQGGWLPALGLGLTLGIAPGFSTSLALLQLPVIAFTLLQWLNGQPLKGRDALVCGAGLVTGTLLVCLPSAPLQAGLFDLRLLSWAQVYMGVATSVVLGLPSVLRRNWPGFIGYVTCMSLLAIPLLVAVAPGSTEVVSVALLPAGMSILLRFTPLVLVTPVALIWLARIALRGSSRHLALIAMTTFGFIVSLIQPGLAHFIIPALLFPPAIALAPVIRRTAGLPLLGIALVWVLAIGINANRFNDPERWNPAYFDIFPLLEALADACGDADGLALVDPDLSNYVLYHSRCAVLANSQAVTASHHEYRANNFALLRSTTKDVLHSSPRPAYILIKRYGDFTTEHPLDGLGLNHDLLQDTPATGGLRLAASVDYWPEPDTPRPVARLYRVKQ